MQVQITVFLSIKVLKNQLDGVLNQVWENLSNQKNASEDLVKPTEDFINGIISLDLLSRILRLTDLLTNSRNFGFVEQQGTYKVKAIDFRIRRDENTFKVNGDNFRGLVDGNGMFTYTDPPMYYVFKEWSKERRRVATKNFFNKSLLKAQDVVEESIKQVMCAIENLSEKNQVNLSAQKKLLKKFLSEYAKDLEYNFYFFGQKLNEICDLYPNSTRVAFKAAFYNCFE